MLDYGRRILIVVLIALCIGLMFIGGTITKATGISENNRPSGWVYPAEGVVSDYFGTRGGAHKGLDIAGVLYSEIVAVSDGIVTKSYLSDSYGHVVFIYHSEEGYETVYAHLNKRLVNVGDNIKQGQVIGEMGSTGRSTGVHLHFEVHQQNWSLSKENAINPLLVFGEMNLDIQHDNQLISVMAAENQQIHTVQHGETLWEISQKYGITVDALKKHNHLQSNKVYTNQKLTIQKEHTYNK